MYDNKEVARITKREIEKQQYYKEREGTDYLLAVSPNIPKNVKNGILGEREGITLVRRDIVVEVAEHLRNAIIEISKSFESKKDQETKQARIYDFITSREFCRRLESLDKDNSGQSIHCYLDTESCRLHVFSFITNQLTYLTLLKIYR